jgi:type VI secretion system secreted protein Hcp
MALKLKRTIAVAIYLQLPNIKGNVSAKYYQGWIECDSFNFGTNRWVVTQPGYVQNRIRSIATATELTVFKKVDPTTIHLFQESLVGKAMDEIKLDICHSDSNPYLQLVFNNALVSEQQVLIENDLTLEYLTFNFTGTEMRYTPYDAQHRAGSPIAVRADVTSRPRLSKQLRCHIQKRTPEGFKLFVAVVYGEMAGIQSSPETVWQAVGSVMVNRVCTGIWLRLESIEGVIKQPYAFDAYIDPALITFQHLDFHNADTRNHQQFLKAWAHLNHISINHKPPVEKAEGNIIDHMQNLLKPIYFLNQPTTNANYYYSPRSVTSLPTFLKGIKNYEQYRINLAGVSDSEVRFYYIPAKVERTAGETNKHLHPG